MFPFIRAFGIYSAILMFFFASSSGATIYANSSNSSGVGILGYGATNFSSFGEVLNTSSGGLLTDFSLFASQGSAGKFDLVLSSWDGTQAVGPALYTSADFSYSGGAQALLFTGINTNLIAGNSYVAYLTVNGVSTPATNVYLAVGATNGIIGGGAVYSNSTAVNPLNSNIAWTNIVSGVPPTTSLDLQFSASISPVPEPEIYALLLAGLGLIASISFLRKNDLSNIPKSA